ncbi:MAG: hypothetical protein RL097_295 [Candidatus Parcubacteria bacterium]|jgi:hypothetical protein
MTLFLTFIAILKVLSIALGVGASTLAVTNFFVAIADGYIDETERRMMGVVYTVLRVAMVAILGTAGMLIAYEYGKNGLSGISPLNYALVTILLVLYSNALLMTAHKVSTTLGPALQAGSWYALGILLALQSLALTNFSYIQFLLGYGAWLLLSVGVINAIMAVVTPKKKYLG